MKYTLFFLFGLACSGVIAQDNFLVTTSGDTITGKISFLAAGKYSEKVVVKNDNGNTEYSANRIQYMKVEGTTYRSLILENKYSIMQEIVPGYLGLYKFRNEGEFDFSIKFLYKKTGEGLAVSSIGFRGAAVEFFEDCDKIADGVEAKKYGVRKLEELVADYNATCVKEAPQLVAPEAGDFSDLSELQSLLSDVLSKMENGEKIPDYLKKAVSEYSQKDVSAMLRNLLKKIDEN